MGPIDTSGTGFFPLKVVRVLGGDGRRVYFWCVLFSCLTFKNSPTFMTSTGVCVHTGAAAAVSIPDLILIHYTENIAKKQFL